MKNIPANGLFVYILKAEGVPVYVGQSINYNSRIASHKKDKQFDSFDLVRVEEKELLDVIEFSYIAALTPRYNVNIPSLDFCMTRLQIKLIADKYPEVLSDFNLKTPDIKIALWSGVKEFWFLNGFEYEKDFIFKVMKMFNQLECMCNGLEDKLK